MKHIIFIFCVFFFTYLKGNSYQVMIVDYEDSTANHPQFTKTSFLNELSQYSVPIPVINFKKVSLELSVVSPFYTLTNNSYTPYTDINNIRSHYNQGTLPIISHGSNVSQMINYAINEPAVRVAAIDTLGNNNNTSYGYGLDFVSKTNKPVVCPVPCQSYATARVTAQFYAIKYKLDSICNCEKDWWEVYDRARKTASNNGIMNFKTGYGEINVNAAVNYSGSLSENEWLLPLQYFGVDTFPQKLILTGNEILKTHRKEVGGNKEYKLNAIKEFILKLGTARSVPYISNSGNLYADNAYFKLDTTTTSGTQARVRLLINNPNGTLGEGDDASSLSVRTGNSLGAESIINFGDQALTIGTTGHEPLMQLYRSNGNFDIKSNLTNRASAGRLSWRGQVNGASTGLGFIRMLYMGDGTTINSEINVATAVAGTLISGFKLDEQSRFWLGSGADDYHFPTVSPSNFNGNRNIQIWTGNGTSNTPAWGTITSLMVDGQYTSGTPTLSSFGSGTFQRYVAVVELTAGATADNNINLPTADVTTFGKSILMSPRDLNTDYDININGNIELNGTLVTTLKLTKPTEFVCGVVAVGPTTYRWIAVDNETTSGNSSISTDGSGDVTITHNKNNDDYNVFLQNTGTTLGVGYTVIAKTSTTFTVRFFDTSTKSTLNSTSVPFDWYIK